jgi:Poly(3-hydroxyalkanoate) synthetase
LNARYLQEMVDALETEPKMRERIRFAVQQWTAAASPSNFFALNPEAQKTLLDSKGESLRQGVMNLLGECSAARFRRRTNRVSWSAKISRTPKARWCSRTT